MQIDTPNSVDRAARMQRERREAEAVAVLRQSTTRRIPSAVFCFALALWSAWIGYHDGYTVVIEGKNVFVVGGLIHIGASICWVCLGIGRLWISPRDRLLRLVVDDYIRRNTDHARKISLDAHAEEQTGTGQPATKPADKLPAETQSPPSCATYRRNPVCPLPPK